MKKIIFLGLLIAAALIQSTLINCIRFLGVKPDLFWIIVLVSGLYFDVITAVFFGLMCGLLKDCFGTYSIGVYTVLLPLWSLVVSSLSKRISFDHVLVSGIFLGVMIFVNAAIVRSIPSLSNGTLPFITFMRLGVMESIYTALVFIWIGPWLRRVAVSTLW